MLKHLLPLSRQVSKHNGCYTYQTTLVHLAQTNVLHAIRLGSALSHAMSRQAAILSQQDEEQGEEASQRSNDVQLAMSAILASDILDSDGMMASEQGVQMLQSLTSANCKIVTGRPIVQRALQRLWHNPSRGDDELPWWFKTAFQLACVPPMLVFPSKLIWCSSRLEELVGTFPLLQPCASFWLASFSRVGLALLITVASAGPTELPPTSDGHFYFWMLMGFSCAFANAALMRRLIAESNSELSPSDASASDDGNGNGYSVFASLGLGLLAWVSILKALILVHWSNQVVLLVWAISALVEEVASVYPSLTDWMAERLNRVHCPLFPLRAELLLEI